MSNPNQEFTTQGDGGTSSSLQSYLDTAARFYEEISAQFTPQAAQGTNPFTDQGAAQSLSLQSDQSIPSSPEDTPEFNPFAGPSDNHFQQQQSREIPIPGSTSTFPREIPTPGSLSSFSDFLEVDASVLFGGNKPEDKLRSLVKEDGLSEAEIAKIKSTANNFKLAEKIVPGFKDPLDLRDIPDSELKPGSKKENPIDPELLRMKEKARLYAPEKKYGPLVDAPVNKKDLSSDAVQGKKILDNMKKSEEREDTPAEAKQRWLDKNLDSDKPVKKSAEVKDSIADEKQRMLDMKLKLEAAGKKPVELNDPIAEKKQRILEQELKKKDPIVEKNPKVEKDPIDKPEVEIQPKPGQKPQSSKPEYDAASDTANGANNAPMENVDVTGLRGKGEQLSAPLNGQKEFVARTTDGSSFIQRSDGTVILNSSEGRTKVSTDGVVTVTANGVERQFHFDNASRVETHKADGSLSYHFQGGTTVTELRQNGEARGLMIKQPNGTTIETNFAQPTQPRYRGRE